MSKLGLQSWHEVNWCNENSLWHIIWFGSEGSQWWYYKPKCRKPVLLDMVFNGNFV